MDFRNITCISESCKDQNIIMDGAGGQFGGRITIAKVRCPNCGTVLMIIPMSERYQYSITATTEEERLADKIKQAQDESQLELAKKINIIKST